MTLYDDHNVDEDGGVPIQKFGIGQLIGKSSLMAMDELKNKKICFTGKTSGENNILLVLNKKACEILFNEDKVADMESLAIFIYKESIPNVHKNYTFRRMFDICDHYISESYINMNEVIYKEGEV